MKILVLADCESKSLYEYFTPEKLEGVELILACGDLKESYLDFFASMTSAPVLFVMGNHDEPYAPGAYSGCVCIEDDIYVYKGIRILGLGGSMQYIPGAPGQYTEWQMRYRIRKLGFKLWRHKGFDILVTHAPAYQVNDLPDLPHRGFAAFLPLLDKYRPKFFLHGHVHANYARGFKRTDTYGETTVVNAYEFYVVEYPLKDH